MNNPTVGLAAGADGISGKHAKVNNNIFNNLPFRVVHVKNQVV